MTLLQDLRYAFRSLARSPGFTAAALLTLAICIGANTAIFSVVHGVLLKPLPFEAADRLVAIHNSYPRAGIERGGAAAPDFFERQELPALEHVALLHTRGLTVGEPGRPVRVIGMGVTPSLFPMLGVRPAAGRTFLPEEGEEGNHHRALLSWGYWQEQFGGAPEAIGGTIRIDDVEHTIVGVMPRGFAFQDANARLWVPIAFGPEAREDNARHTNNWEMVARLSPGSTIEQARQQIAAQNAATAERIPQLRSILEQAGYTLVVAEYRSELTREVRGTLWLLQGGVLLVLLIGCVNIANLILVRATARRRELVTRAALGARRWRIGRQLITESVALAIAGGLLGLLGALAAVEGFATFAIERLPRGTEIAIDGTTLAVTIGVSALAGMLFGVLPMLRLSSSDLATDIREGGRSGTSGRRTHAVRGGLVVAQVALAFTVLVGAGLLLSSFARTLAVDPGLDPRGVLTASVSLPVTRYPGGDSRRQFTERLLEELRGVPGVEASAVTSVVPFSGSRNATGVTPEGGTPRQDDSLVAPVVSSISDAYFATAGIGLLAGRPFGSQDGEGSPPVAIIDRYLAERFWPGQDPIGKGIALGNDPGGGNLEFRTVVGIVAETRVATLTGDQTPGHLYVPVAQIPSADFGIMVRAQSGLPGVGAAIRSRVTALDPDLAIFDVRSMEELVANSVATERLRTLLLMGFGTLALLLAAIGLYGVLAYSVAQRRAEIGIRMALGSTPEATFRMVVGKGARLVGAGLLVGLGASMVVGRLVRTLLFGVEPGDPLVLVAALTLLAATALAACILPARRAMKVNPMVAIREAS